MATSEPKHTRFSSVVDSVTGNAIYEFLKRFGRMLIVYKPLVAMITAIISAILAWRDFHSAWAAFAFSLLLALVAVSILAVIDWRKYVRGDTGTDSAGIGDKLKVSAGQAALLWHFETEAKGLEQFLQSIWHRWNSENEALMHPLQASVEIKNWNNPNAINLASDLHEFKTLYQHHLSYLKGEMGDFKSLIMSHTLPSNLEYPEVLAALQEHAKALGKEAQVAWDSILPSKN